MMSFWMTAFHEWGKVIVKEMINLIGYNCNCISLPSKESINTLLIALHMAPKSRHEEDNDLLCMLCIQWMCIYRSTKDEALLIVIS